jgi:hypothetical protein
MRTVSVIVFFLISFSAFARQEPDSLAVSKLYGTSWTLTGKYRISGVFHRKHKLETSEMSITIYKDEIHTALSTGKYQICASRHRNKNEFWLDCALPDQFIYRVIKIEGDVLVMDVLSRPKGRTDYVRTSRNYYTRKKS